MKESFIKEEKQPISNKQESIKQNQVMKNNNHNPKEMIITKLHKILELIEKFEKNQNLMLIILNFLKMETIKDIELYAIPKRKENYHLKPLYKLQDIESSNFDKIRYTLVSALQKSKKDKEALDEFNISDTDVKFRNPSLNKLFKSLIGQNYLSNNIEEKEALCFIFSEKQRKQKFQLFNDLCSQYNVKKDIENTEIIKHLYSLDINISSICVFLALKEYINNDFKLYSDCIKNTKSLVNKEIKSIKEKSYLENLIAGKVAPIITIPDIDLMSGAEFENFVANFFSKIGYKTRVTKSSGDQGIDVIATKNDFIVAIQTKCYHGVVGNHAIMEAVAGMKYYNANKCMVITNSTFTKSAQELAKANNVEIWDRQILKEKLEELYV